MKLHSTNAFLIWTKKMNEADLLLSYVTEDYGKISCFANNARKSKKRFLGKLEPAMLTNIKFYEKPGMTLDILYEADLIEDYKNVRKDIDVYLFLTKIIEIARVLTQERDKNKNVFDLIRSVYGGLNNINVGAAGTARTAGIGTILFKFEIYFIANLLKHMGLFPNFKECMVCGAANKNNDFYFSLREGGVVCKKCSGNGINISNGIDGLDRLGGIGRLGCSNNSNISSINIPINFINILDLMTASDVSIVNKLTVNDEILKNCSNFLERFLSYHTGKKLKSLDAT